MRMTIAHSVQVSLDTVGLDQTIVLLECQLDVLMAERARFLAFDAVREANGLTITRASMLRWIAACEGTGDAAGN